MHPPKSVEGRISHPVGGKDALRHRRRRLSAVAGEQFGVIARRQLVALDFTEREIDRLTAGPWLIPLHAGVYAVGHTALRREARWMAAVLAGGEGAALSHRSAAARRGWPVYDTRLVDIVVRDRSHHSRPGIAVHRPVALLERDVAVVDGIACTSVARTIVDVSATESLRTIERCVQASDRAGEFDLRAVRDVLSRVARPRGVRKLRHVLDTYEDRETRSELEEDWLAFARSVALPVFVMNAPMALGDGRTPVADVLFPHERLIIELGGDAFHGDRIAVRDDRVRDNEAAALGFQTMRFANSDLRDTRERTYRLLTRTLERRRADLPRSGG
jgi:very-short-patch-repair endonuclease